VSLKVSTFDYIEMDGAPPQSPVPGTPLAQGAPSPYPMLASPPQTQVVMVNPLQMLQAPGTPMPQAQDSVIARTMSVPQMPQMGVSGLLVLHQGSRFTKTMHVSIGCLRGVPAAARMLRGSRSVL
jgi:hypothetical protein